MSQKRGNNGEKFKRKIFLVKIGARKKGFLKKKIANIGAKKAKKQAKNLKNQYINGVFETEKV